MASSGPGKPDASAAQNPIPVKKEKSDEEKKLARQRRFQYIAKRAACAKCDRHVTRAGCKQHHTKAKRCSGNQMAAD